MVKLDKDKLPQHIAIIMDGNRRWAKKRGLPAMAGHKYVAEVVIEKLIERVGDLGIPYITFWAWSSENWKRPKREVAGIMKLFQYALEKLARRMIERGARMRVIGDVAAFSPSLQKGIERFVEESKDNTKITVTFGLNYGGREEMVRAIKEILRQSGRSHSTRSAQAFGSEAQARRDDKAALKSLAALSNEEWKIKLEENLDTMGMPEPDLIIRPGGTKRLSGFMLWQAEYSELYFTDTLMPDFGVEELDKALVDYAKRERRFGGGGFGEYE